MILLNLDRIAGLKRPVAGTATGPKQDSVSRSHFRAKNAVPLLNPDRYQLLGERALQKFLSVAGSRVGYVGVLLEMKHARLFRLDSYSVDDWGATLRVSNVPLAGFKDFPRKTAEISGRWDGFCTDKGRFQVHYCWKFLFGAEQMQSLIVAGAEAATYGQVVTCDQVHQIFHWHSYVDRRKAKGLCHIPFEDLTKWLFKPPLCLPATTSESFGGETLTID